MKDLLKFNIMETRFIAKAVVKTFNDYSLQIMQSSRWISESQLFVGDIVIADSSGIYPNWIREQNYIEDYINCNFYANGDDNLAVKLFLELAGMQVENDLHQWFKENDIPLYGIQTNPTQHEWTTSPKSYAPLMIDDSALGCPLKFDPNLSDRPFVDWRRVRELLIEMKIL